MKYEYWLAAITPLSDRKKYLLRKHLGSGECIFYICLLYTSRCV